jgi:hypothetical protein
MQPFTQKYAIIQLFDEKPVGTRFSSANWPLHSTIVDTFAIDWSLPTMIEKLTNVLQPHSIATSTVGEDLFIGEKSQVRVAKLAKTDSLVQLHYDVIKQLEQGGLKLNDPQFAKEGFLPHSTVQSHARLIKGDAVTFSALSIIDFFPVRDPYQRKVIATIPIVKNTL